MGVNAFYKSRPWVAAWWSVALPGLGHINLGLYLKGFILLAGEILFNTLGHINLAMYYAFLGQFRRSDLALDHGWTILYCSIWAFGVFDAYRVAVESNKEAWLESKQEVREFIHNSLHSMDKLAVEKRIPWYAAFWSALFTGLGQLYSHRIVTGFLLIGLTVTITEKTNLPYAVIDILTGDLQEFHTLQTNYEWALFFPSIYAFGIYDAYQYVVTMNRLFRDEQVYYLQEAYGGNPVHIEKGHVTQPDD